MSKEKNFRKKIGNIILIIIIIGIVYFVLNICSQKYFNEFTRAEYNLYTSEFSRDKSVKYSDYASYKITSDVQNDAMFYKTVDVNPNTAYKVTCMIKTENVTPESVPSNSGAQISIADTIEKSTSITGTNDWQEVSLYFNSRNRETVDIAFRLGGYGENCTGTAWFSDFKIEQGQEIEDSKWNMACFIFKNLDVNIDVDGQKNYQDIEISMNSSDIASIRQNMDRFASSLSDMAEENISIEYDIIEIDEPITTLSFDEKNQYYIASENIENIIAEYIKDKQYQHIFAAVKFSDENSKYEVPVNHWLGLGSMTFNGVGFSNIRLQSSIANSKYEYRYNNVFPEEVFIHEFLHDLERIAVASEYEIIELHDYEKYNYRDSASTGLREWYEDYINKRVYDKEKTGYVGLPSNIFELRPASEDDFRYSIEKPLVDEPENILEEIKMYIETSVQTLAKMNEN